MIEQAVIPETAVKLSNYFSFSRDHSCFIVVLKATFVSTEVPLLMLWVKLHPCVFLGFILRLNSHRLAKLCQN